MDSLERIHVQCDKLEQPPLNRRPGLQRYLSPTYNAALSFLPPFIQMWAHLALATHMKAGSQVALTALKLRAHTCP